MGELTGVSEFIDGHFRRELVQVSPGVGDVRGHCDREFIGEGVADTGGHGEGRSGGKGDKSTRQEGDYCYVHFGRLGGKEMEVNDAEELEEIVVMNIVSGIDTLYIPTRGLGFQATYLKISTKRNLRTTQPCHLNG